MKSVHWGRAGGEGVIGKQASNSLSQAELAVKDKGQDDSPIQMVLMCGSCMPSFPQEGEGGDKAEKCCNKHYGTGPRVCLSRTVRILGAFSGRATPELLPAFSDFV